ncbi:MAG: hypothetical protein US57_C0002G0032 [Candidatus Moranbacteria bacterium GW2011_GWC2_37_73]|nr:MAG: hypothetical protein UR95_C0002G0130 [Parcubacteria group bacterium GW2011_GWC1_36_108]KKQ01027.1 MAG: hypothetical protein US09_C0003G0027 [Candidatus Moranbacteria bacterium GW2011_GWD1_36_198]KKQ02429.1 MAG: hypothetical protein US10_C0001G0027 [Candidatus Moranbacteria bacterium GW2011_GWD2_36_198]KKQ40325.1 MAG: hypothetical protein US57_C0002G0032 [Candidatus Moranbacteria bacterium GW2011_GWC2_37_73]HBU10872.1 hypothetical protein [Candidatus Moranbacteria bacterium]
MKQILNITIVFASLLFTCPAFADNNTDITITSVSNDIEVKQQQDVSEAKRWLEIARKPFGDNTAAIRYIREAVEKADVTLKFIGTSEKEISQLLTKGYLAEAKRWLEHARNRLADNKHNIKYVHEALAKADATPASIGTSEEELQELLTDGYVAEAKLWLGYARNRSDNNENNINFSIQALEKADASFEDIDSSAEEMLQLLVDGYIAEARKWFGYALEKEDNQAELDYCLEALLKASYVADLAFILED